MPSRKKRPNPPVRLRLRHRVPCRLQRLQQRNQLADSLAYLEAQQPGPGVAIADGQLQRDGVAVTDGQLQSDRHALV